MSSGTPSESTPLLIARDQHAISRANISPNALKVLYRLKDEGYRACLVGGGVRDLLLGREPKDFDIATDAHPEQVKALFRNCRLIGRRFRLAHVIFGREIIEVATFRGQHDAAEEEEHARQAESGRILRDNVYGSIEDDVWRRDFTINSLYYDIADFSVVDYTGGMADLQQGVIRLIGDPEQRYREDPVRMLRAIRFAAKLGFRLDEAAAAPIAELSHLLFDIAPARLFDEILKLLLSGDGVKTFEMLRQYDLFRALLPMTDEVLAEEEQGFPHMLVVHALKNTDARIAEGKPVTPAFFFAAMLWEPMLRAMPDWEAIPDMSELQAMQIAAARIVSKQAQHTAIPKRFSLPMREIWAMQPKFQQRNGRRPLKLLEHPKFRAAYDFLLLRGQAGEIDQELCDWWTRIQELEPHDQEKMLLPDARKNKRRRRRGPRKRNTSASS